MDNINNNDTTPFENTTEHSIEKKLNLLTISFVIDVRK